MPNQHELLGAAVKLLGDIRKYLEESDYDLDWRDDLLGTLDDFDIQLARDLRENK